MCLILIVCLMTPKILFAKDFLDYSTYDVYNATVLAVCLTNTSNFKDIITAIIKRITGVTTVACGRVRAVTAFSFTANGNR